MAMFVKTNRQEKNHSIKVAQNKQTERITSRHTNTERDKKNNLISYLNNPVKQRNKYEFWLD